MKKSVLVLLFLLAGWLATPAVEVQPLNSGDVMVYICTGSSSKRFHRTTRCRGLDNCKGSVIKVTLAEAKRKHRTPCKLCYK